MTLYLHKQTQIVMTTMMLMNAHDPNHSLMMIPLPMIMTLVIDNEDQVVLMGGLLLGVHFNFRTTKHLTV